MPLRTDNRYVGFEADIGLKLGMFLASMIHGSSSHFGTDVWVTEVACFVAKQLN